MNNPHITAVSQPPDTQGLPDTGVLSVAILIQTFIQTCFGLLSRAGQRARHYDGRRAGVFLPAQHHGEAALRPGEGSVRRLLGRMLRFHRSLS